MFIQIEQLVYQNYYGLIFIKITKHHAINSIVNLHSRILLGQLIKVLLQR